MLKSLKPLATVAAAALSLNAHAAVDMFLKLDGIAGESQDKAHNGEVDVLAWSWGMSQSGTTHVGGGGGDGIASFADISVTKWVDKSSVPVMKLIATGGHISEATLTIRKSGITPFVFEELIMYNVLATSASTGGSGGEDRLIENITLNFEAFCITYTEQRPDGSAGTKPKLCFNIATNATCTVDQVNTLFNLPLVMSLPGQIRARLAPVCSNT